MAANTETIMMYARIFPDLMDSSLPDVEGRLERLGKLLFNIDRPEGEEEDRNDDVTMQKIDLRSPISPVLFMVLFCNKVSNSKCLFR